MKVKIMANENGCRDKQGRVYYVERVRVVVPEGKDRYYYAEDSFFKAVCCKGTIHNAKELQPGEVMIW